MSCSDWKAFGIKSLIVLADIRLVFARADAPRLSGSRSPAKL